MVLFEFNIVKGANDFIMKDFFVKVAPVGNYKRFVCLIPVQTFIFKANGRKCCAFIRVKKFMRYFKLVKSISQ
jgi:hypothetical protein